MIDYLAIGATHLMLVLAALRLLSRADLDRDIALPTPPLDPPRTAAQANPTPTHGPVPRLPRLGKSRRRA